MKLFSPKMRLRVRGNERDFVSSDVRVDNHKSDIEKNGRCTHWPWSGKVDEESPR